MKNLKANYFKRIISIIILIAIFLSNGIYTVYAEELPDFIEKYVHLSEDGKKNDENECNDNIISDESFALLERINDFDSFTDAEKMSVLELIGMGYDNDGNASDATEFQTQLNTYFEVMPENAKNESQIIRIMNEVELYSKANSEEKSIILKYLDISDKNTAKASDLIEKVQSKNVNLFDAVLIVQIMADGMFDIDEALFLYNKYDNRPERDNDINAFKSFAKLLAIPDIVVENNLTVDLKEKGVVVEDDQLKEKINSFGVTDTYYTAKKLFLEGYSVDNIKAAYIVAAAVNISPNELITKDKKIEYGDYEFLKSYPINIISFKSAVEKIINNNIRNSTELDGFIDEDNSNIESQIINIREETIGDIKKQIEEYRDMFDRAYAPIDYSSTIVEDILPPFKTDISDKESVNLNTGDVNYRENIVSLSGINNLDLNLDIVYNSGKSNFEQYSNNVNIVYYILSYTQSTYAIVGSYYILYDRQRMQEFYLDRSSRDARLSQLTLSSGESVILSPSYYDVISAQTTWVNHYRMEGLYNPYEITYNASNPAPSYMYYDDGMYSGYLPRTDTIMIYDTGVVLDGIDPVTGRQKWYQEGEWIAVYSGNASVSTNMGENYYHNFSSSNSEDIGIAADYIYDQTFYEERYDIGTGWSFDIPYIEHGYNYDRLYIPGKGSYDVKITSDGNYIVNPFTGYQQYYYDGLYIDECNLTFNGIRATSVVHIIGDNKYYFDVDGHILCCRDKYDNSIQYKYTLINGSYKLSEIIDTVGRSVYISYVSTSTGKNVVITRPDLTTVTLKVDYYNSLSSDYILSKITYPNNTYTDFIYSYYTSYFSYSQKSNSSYYYTNALLSEVDYYSGARLKYTYSGVYVNLGFGNLGYRYVYRANSRKYTANGIDYGELIYSYFNEYSNYPNTGTIPSNYFYLMIITDSNGLVTDYEFNYKHLLTEKALFYNNILQKIYTYSYMSNTNNVIMSSSTVYGTSAITNTELYSYDIYDNVLTYISPKGLGDSTNTEYRTTFTYDSRYNILTSESYKTSLSQTTTIYYVLSSSGKEVTSVLAYDNNELKSKCSFEYDLLGRITAKNEYKNDLEYIRTQYVYNGADVVSITVLNVLNPDNDAHDITEYYSYDSSGRVTAYSNGNGEITYYTYDVMGRNTAVYQPDGVIISYAFNDLLNTTTYSKTGEDSIIYTYNPLGLLVSARYSSEPTAHILCSYDNRGRKTSEMTDLGTTVYTYDMWDRLLSLKIKDLTNTTIYQENYSYDDALTSQYSQVEKTVVGDYNSSSIVEKTQYTRFGEVYMEDNASTVADPSTAVYYVYDYIGRCIFNYYFKSDNTGVIIGQYAYDLLGNVTAYTDVYNNTKYSVYDWIGRKTSETDYNNNSTSYLYDNMNRVIITSSPFNNASYSYSITYYDNVGNVIKEKQSNNADNTSVISYSTIEYNYSNGHLTDVITHVDATNKQYSHYSYSGDKLVGLYSGMSQQYSSNMPSSDYSLIQYTYDSHGNVASITDALNQTEYYTYDNYGNILTKTDRKGQVTRYTYNALGKVITDKVYANANATIPLSSIISSYTSTGVVKNISADNSTISYYYDAAGRVVLEYEDNGAIIKSYTYNGLGNITDLGLYINNSLVSSTQYGYDNGGRMVSTTAGNSYTTYLYDNNGNLTQSAVSGSGATTLYSYNKANLVTSVINICNNNIIDQDSVNYNTNGYIRRRDTYNESHIYSYDYAGRLTSEYDTGVTYSYVYDAANNRASVTKSGSDGYTINYTYDKNNRLLSENKGGNITSYSYDSNGNTLSDGTGTYTYNARNQEVSYTKSGNTTSYTYNTSGLRKTKTTGGLTKYFVWSNANIIYEYEYSLPTNGTAYYYGINRINSSGGDYYIYNAHGDVAYTISSIGVIQRSYSYDAFGNEKSPVTGDSNPFRYCAEYYDSESDSYYLRSRYYKPSTGRFLSQDSWEYANPNDSLSLNLYLYCYGNPVSYCDPDGFAIEWIAEYTRKFSRLVFANQLVVHATKYGYFPQLFEFFGFISEKYVDYIIYHAKVDAWQQYFGYNGLYDLIFDYGTNMDKETFPFVYFDRKIVFWIWKGDYLNLGAGAELGIYSPTIETNDLLVNVSIHSPILGHYLVDKDLSMNMSMKLKYSNEFIGEYYPEEKQWWITTFNPWIPDIDINLIRSEFYVKFDDEALYTAFYNQYPEENRKNILSFDVENKTAIFTF